MLVGDGQGSLLQVQQGWSCSAPHMQLRVQQWLSKCSHFGFGSSFAQTRKNSPSLGAWRQKE